MKKLKLKREDMVVKDKNLIEKVVKIGDVIRRYQSEGNLSSVPPPTIYGYLSFLRLAKGLPHLSLQQISSLTLLGNASSEDSKYVTSVFNEVFGIRSETDNTDPTLGGDLF
jgi:hypothetical protein